MKRAAQHRCLACVASRTTPSGLGPGAVNEGAAALGEALKVNGVLAKLNLDGCELDLPKLRGTDPVTSLDLSGKHLGSASAIVIASLIAGNEVLTNLSLYWNEIGDEGAAALASALRVNGVLTVLNVGGNKIGPEGAKAIGKALAVNRVLKSINLRANDLGEEGETVIRDAVSGREGFRLEM